MLTKEEQKKSSVIHMNWLSILFGIALFIIIAINGLSFYQLHRFSVSMRLVDHTYQVINASQNILNDMLSSETSARSYFITQDEDMIDSLEENSINMKKDYQILKNLTKDNPLQQKNVDSLEAILEKRIAYFHEVIRLRKISPEINSEIIFLTIKSQRAAVQIRFIIENISQVEFVLLKTRNERVGKEFYIAAVIIISVTLINIILLIFIFLILKKTIKRQKISQEQISQSENLLKNIMNGTNEMVAAIDLDFNLIAYNFSYEENFKKLYGNKIYIGCNIKNIFKEIQSEKINILSLWERAIQGEEYTAIISISDLNNITRQYEISFSSIDDSQNQLIGASHIQRDVTFRIAEENELIKSKKNIEITLEKLKKHNVEMLIISDMNSALQSSSSIEEMLEILQIYCTRLLPKFSGALYIINSSSNFLEEKMLWNDPKMKTIMFSPGQCWALLQGKIYFYSNASEKIPCKHQIQEKIENYICIPLLAQNEVVGVLYLESKKLTLDDNSIQEDINQPLIENIAAHISLAIANIKLHETLKMRAIIDPLTTLYNRSYLNESLERDVQRANRQKSRLVIVMMDIDDFKMINDTYGHEAGDRVLHEIGKTLSQNTRQSDLLCRYGGEEFLIALYDASKEEAYKQIESLRQQIEKMVVSFGHNILGSFSASFGIAICPEDGDTMEKVIAAADTALYQSKNTGKNKITLYKK